MEPGGRWEPWIREVTTEEEFEDDTQYKRLQYERQQYERSQNEMLKQRKNLRTPNLIERAGELPRWWVGIVFRACFGGALEEADIRELQCGLHN